MTSATDELRRLLDERGVEWTSGDTEVSRNICTDFCPDAGVSMSVWENDGKLGIDAHTLYRFTPEQAIVATLGRGTCEQEEGGWSTEGDHARVWLTCGHDCMVETVADLPNFCPVCGAKVVSE